VLDSSAEGPGVQIAAATLSGNNLRQIVHTHCASVHQAAKLVAALLRVAGVTAGLAESNGNLPLGFMTHVTCRLTAKNRDQLRNPTLCNRVWATFFLFFPTFATAHPRYGGLYRRFSLSVSCLILHGRCVSISPSELQYRQLGHSASWQASSGSP